MKNLASYYEILGIEESATTEEIKKAYRNLALWCHPDRVPESIKKKAGEEFKKIQEAYDVLADPGKRKQYDEQLKNLKTGRPFDQPDSSDSPVLQVDKTYFEFKDLRWGATVSDSFSVSNAGGGTLTGTIKTVYGWIVLSESVIDAPYSQEIKMAIDTTILLADQAYSEEIEIRTNGGNETIYVDISTAPRSNMDTIISLARSIVSKRWFKPLSCAIIGLEFVICILLIARIPNYFGSHKEGVQTTGSETLRTASEKSNERTSQEHSNLPNDKIVVNEILIREDGTSEMFPVVKDVKEVERTFLGQKAGYPRKETVKDEPVDETGIFYPKTGAYYPIERARYPEFYKKCDSNRDGIVMLSELGKAQRELNKITDKYPEGDVDSIVKEFVK